MLRILTASQNPSLPFITKIGPTRHISPAWAFTTQAGNSLPQLTRLSACSHTAQEKRLCNKHCNNIGAFLQSQNLGMLKPWLELYCALQRLGCDLLYYQEYLSTGSKDLCRVSAASTDRGKTMGTGSYKCCSKVFFICLFKMDNTR